VLTTSHAYWTWRAARSRPRGAAAVAGAVAPDVPALALGAAGAARGLRGPELLGWVYRRPAVGWVHAAAHSALAPLLLAVVPRPAARALAAGWAGHLLADALTHRDDAWPHLAPLSRRTLASPVSYWQPEHGGRAWSAAESAALAAALLLERGAGRRALALGALAAAALPLARPRTWEAHGCATPTREGRPPPGPR
jgi:hypothetical protein